MNSLINIIVEYSKLSEEERNLFKAVVDDSPNKKRGLTTEEIERILKNTKDLDINRDLPSVIPRSPGNPFTSPYFPPYVTLISGDKK